MLIKGLLARCGEHHYAEEWQRIKEPGHRDGAGHSPDCIRPKLQSDESRHEYGYSSWERLKGRLSDRV